MRIGFDRDLYIEKQTEHILKRMEQFDNKLYLEFGGKLFDDYHAARVLPGFDVNAKVKLLKNFADKAEIVFCINANSIEKNKIRADFGITYDQDLLRTIDAMRGMGLLVNSVVITQYADQPGAITFRNMLEQRGVKTYKHYPIKGYPTDVNLIVSENGYGANEFVETTRPLVVVTAPGPNSGKLATCLSQLYHENRRGVQAGYAKFETFPVWNLPLRHPVNLAYEAATADLKDVNMIDPLHLDAYGVTAVNYNRDIEGFPIVNTILTRITNKTIYQSPTDMGVNTIASCIVDDEVVREAATQEIVRRYYKTWCECRMGREETDTAYRIEKLLSQLDVDPESARPVAVAAKRKAEQSGSKAMAIELPDGRIVTGRSQSLMNAAASCVINAIKTLAGIADEVHLMSPVILEPIVKMKRETLGRRSPKLNLEEMLVALSICAATNPMAELALSKLPQLKGCEAHTSYMVTAPGTNILRSLGMNVTCEAVFETDALYND
ncbi:MAG: DUF1846 domain-containing protein [Ruminococcaceae bacterium]|nr:DUF1846 domain-containing protein [Oscillospiraceae bacterium]